MNPRQPRPIDHCVLPVESLDSAQDRLTKLGFTVAPRADHPFGTANACVYFSDNTYLEPLAIVDPKLAGQTALKRNVFAVRDSAYRFRNGPEGFSALVMGTQNAKADHRRFVFAGISAGRQLVFSRPFTAPDGEQGEASFRLAFAADPRSPDAFFFVCERIKQPDVDRNALQTHANGVVGTSRVVMSEPYPSDFTFLCQELARTKRFDTHPFGIDVPAANGTVSVLNAKGCASEFGISIGRERGLQLQAIVFEASSLARTEKLLKDNDVAYDMLADRLIVKPSKGQGAVFAFEEMSQ